MAQFFTSYPLREPVTQEVRNATNRMLSQLERIVPWAGSLVGPAAAIFNAGGYPLPATSEFIGQQFDDDKAAAWKIATKDYRTFIKPILDGDQELGLQQVAAAAANSAYWDSVYQATLAVATLGVSKLWDEMISKMKEYNTLRAKALADVDKAKEAGDMEGAQALYDQVVAQDNGIWGTINSYAAKVPGLAQAIQAEGVGLNGLGALPALAALSAPMLTAIIIAVGVAISAMAALGYKTVSTLGVALPIGAIAVIGLIAWRMYQKSKSATA